MRHTARGNRRVKGDINVITPKLNDEQIENLTYSLYTNLMDFKQLNTGFMPSREDIIKCLDYALKD